MEKETLSQYYIFLILIPVLCGTIARYLTLIIDYRQYPSYPNGYLKSFESKSASTHLWRLYGY